MLKFYYFVGKVVSRLANKNTYGNNLIENISKDLKEKVPSLSGLSIANIGYMKRFYEAFSDIFSALNQNAIIAKIFSMKYGINLAKDAEKLPHYLC